MSKPPIKESASESQLRRLAAHWLLENKAYTKEQATKLISAEKSPPSWNLANDNGILIQRSLSKSITAEIRRIEKGVEMGKLDLAEDYKDYGGVNEYLGGLREDLDAATSEIESFKEDEISEREDDRERLREAQELLAFEYGHLLKRPNQKQLKQCLDDLNAQAPDWEEKHGYEALAATLMATFPELKKTGGKPGKKAKGGGCLIVFLFLLVPLIGGSSILAVLGLT
jgi:hypothetical protein